MGFNILNNLSNLLPKTAANSTTTGLGLQDFYSVATKRGFARDFHFRITQIGDSPLGNNDLIYIRSGTIPEREVLSDEFTNSDFDH